MNAIEIANKLLDLCLIPKSIQLVILNLLIGYGTPSADAFKNRSKDAEIPIRVLAVNGFESCRYTIHFMDRMILRCYDNASHYTKIALFELHCIYLLNKKRQTQFIVSQSQLLTNCIRDYTKNRHLQLTLREDATK